MVSVHPDNPYRDERVRAGILRWELQGRYRDFHQVILTLARRGRGWLASSRERVRLLGKAKSLRQAPSRRYAAPSPETVEGDYFVRWMDFAN
jgi:hypothetical protein